MKKDKLNVIIVFMFVMGLSVMLYPAARNQWIEKMQTEVIDTRNGDGGDFVAADAYQVDVSLVALVLAVTIMFLVLIVLLVAQTISWNREQKQGRIR